MSKKNMIFKKNLVAHALVLAFGGGVFMMGVTPSAMAQSADGSIFGRTTSKAQVQIKSLETGSSRVIEAESNGSFTFSKLSPGKYQVIAAGISREVNVVIGTGTEVKFDNITTVTVAGRRNKNAIDVSSTESNTVFTLAEIQNLPVSRNATAVAMLAPGTVKGDSAFGGAAGLASFSGASVAENGYYINGFDVTNIRNFTSYANLPFGAMSQQQVKSGGYGAEYGRSLGGVVSLSTKRGTNTWQGGGAVYWAPEAFSARGKNVRDLVPENNEGFNGYTVYRHPDTSNSAVYEAYVGGPIIKDSLFVFGLIEGRKTSEHNYEGATSTHKTNQSPNGVLKIDWQVSDNHRLEFTGISNKNKSETLTYDNNTAADKFAVRHIGVGRPSQFETGGDVLIGKYTGYLTDNLTISGQVGRVNTLTGKTTSSDDVGSDCPAIYENGQPVYGCWNPDHFTLRDPSAPDNTDKRKSSRLDLEYMLGSHTIRAGFDGQTFTSAEAGNAYSGGIYYRYYTMPADKTVNGVPNAGIGSQYVRSRVFRTKSGSYEVKNNALYVEDSWKATKEILVYGGLRSESFENKTADGVNFVEAKNLLAPRLGVAWDVNGDSSLKLYANAGRYFIPVASNSNYRMFSAAFDQWTFHNFNGKDPRTLAPLNLGPQIGDKIDNGDGKLPDPATSADSKLQPMNQDEYILGFQKALSKSLTVGVKYIHRSVNDGMDDFCGQTGIGKWALDNGHKNFDPSTLKCILMNPGRDLNLKVDLEGDGKLVAITVPSKYLGLAKYERKYDALEFTMDRPFDGTWGLSGSYVYSRSRGTAEGYVQSDLKQEDAGITQDFDFGSFTDGAFGTLPNNRTHVFKAFGNYAINDQIRVGANAELVSGRTTSCIGYVPKSVSDFYGPSGATTGGSGAYDSASSYYCLNDKGESVLGKRGNGRVLPWTYSLDLNAAYTLKLANGNKLTFQLDIFNVFNSQKITAVNQRRDYSRATTLSVPGRINENYMRPKEFEAPRSGRVTARYEF